MKLRHNSRNSQGNGATLDAKPSGIQSTALGSPRSSQTIVGGRNL